MTAKKPPEEHKKSGPPTKYRSHYAKQAKALAKLGATDFELAQFFGVATSTFGLWLVTHPKLSDAVKLGRHPPDRRTERSLFHRANGYSYESEEIYLVDEIELRPGEGEDAEPVKVITKKVLRVPTIKHVPPDSTAMIFWLKNRKPGEWRDRKDVTLANPPGKIFQTEALPPAPETIGKYYERLAEIAADRAARRPARAVGETGVPDPADGEGSSEG